MGDIAARADGPVAEPDPSAAQQRRHRGCLGEIAASAERRGRPRPQNDTWVAACCPAYELPLATLNVKDFRDFAQHEGLILVTG
jgi:predicted nucleic acid-binding protein